MTVFKHQMPIPFHLCDPAGILFFGHFFGLAHSVYELWIVEQMGSWDLWFSNPKWVAPIIATSGQFVKPVKGGDVFSLELKLNDVTTSSFTTTTSFIKDGVCHATIKTTQVFCERTSFKKTNVPNEVKAFIKADS